MKERKLYQILASRFVAWQNCVKSNNKEWEEKHQNTIRNLVKNWMPSGSGVDCGTKFDFDASKEDKLVFNFSFHHMNDSGMYDGWTEHRCVVTPSLSFGFNLKITGPNRNGIKEYLHEIYSCDLDKVIDAQDEIDAQY